MKLSHRTLITFLLLVCIFLNACGVKGPEAVQWGEPDAQTEFEEVESDSGNIDQLDGNDSSNIDEMGSISNSRFEYVEWCLNTKGYTETIHCAGDENNGWWEIKNNRGEITEIQVMSNGNNYVIRIVDGQYYLDCGNGENMEIDDSVVGNIKARVAELDDAYKLLDTAKSDLYASLVGVLGSVVGGCVAGALAGAAIGAPAGGIGAIPGAIIGCKVGSSMITAISIAASLGEKVFTGLTQMAVAKKELRDAKNELNKIMVAYCN